MIERLQEEFKKIGVEMDCHSKQHEVDLQLVQLLNVMATEIRLLQTQVRDVQNTLAKLRSPYLRRSGTPLFDCNPDDYV